MAARRLTAKQKRRAAALKAAATRKRNAAKRSAAARKAAKSRKVQAERAARVERIKVRVRAARKAKETEAANARFDALGRRGFGLTARTPKEGAGIISTRDAWETLREMIRDNDPRWLRFHADMRSRGFSEQAIHDYWFSPPEGWANSITAS
jgi:hypothetical protein